ncbi:hypothetical protein RRG08_026965 [Elysia crispata]|uniref:Uncharacterized protein n=1 Tax=Elysia crispata TaxID=231223 RepID=A0AAE0YQB3_9GAST|nr:hypothetical protein RRG08_026965 [Elysia crispata]
MLSHLSPSHSIFLHLIPCYSILFHLVPSILISFHLVPVDFDDAVDILTEMIDSELTNSICQFACIASAVYVMGPVGEMYGQMACPPLCAAILAKLEDVPG